MFWDRFVLLCNQKGVKPNNVTKDLNLSSATATHWKKGAMPNSTTLHMIANYFGVTVDTLTGDESTPHQDIKNIEPLPQSRRLPLVGTIACGEPILAEQNIERYISCPDTISADFVLRCKGDSMIGSRIQDGDLVFIRSQPDVDNGQIAAVLIDGEATLKRVYKYPGKLVLYPENPRYEPLLFTGQELLNIRILGLAVAFTSVL